MLKQTGKILLKMAEWLVFLVLISLIFVILSPVLPIKGLPRTFVVVSGSMEPTIKTGSIAFTKEIDSKLLTKGDIVAFTSPNNPKDTILHRVNNIVSTEPLLFETRGDNNNASDNWSVMASGIKGKLMFSIPYLGHAGALVKKPWGFVMMIGIPALLFVISQLLNIKKAIAEEIDNRVNQGLKLKKKDKRIDSSLKSIGLSLILLPTFLSLSTLSVIEASFLDTVEVRGISLTVKDFVPPTTPTNLGWSNPEVACGGFTKSQTITAVWNEASDNLAVTKYEYQVHYPKIGGGWGLWNTFVTQPRYSGVFNQDEGIHTYKVRAYDAEGNASPWSAECSITYDKTIPSSVIIYPFNSDEDNSVSHNTIWWNGKVRGTSADNASGIDRVELSIYRRWLNVYWNGVAWVPGTETTTRVLATGTTSWNYDFFNIPPAGLFRIIAHAIDKAGNVENSAIIEFENAEMEVTPDPSENLTLTPTELVGTTEPTITGVPTQMPTLMPTSAPIIQPDFMVQLNKSTNKVSFYTTNYPMTEIDYEILYQDGAGDQGIAGKIPAEDIVGGVVSREYFLGTCSTNGTCTPDTISIGSTISVNLNGQIKTISY